MKLPDRLLNNTEKSETKHNQIKANDIFKEYHDYTGIFPIMQRLFTTPKSSCNSHIKRKRGRKPYNLTTCRKVI